ncbi:MAG: hypothetical protein COB38_02435 [Gammaproteobacteria bacterium]|nr:MAG: hypothetical protein COB38_02435 [Gammaproteobacteria bacterium]
MLIQNNSLEQLLVVIAPVEIKDDLVDTLMSLECVSGFNFSEIGGYSKTHSQYDIGEQVQGYRKLQRFEIVHQSIEEAIILKALKKVCRNAQIRYWISPINSMGHI